MSLTPNALLEIKNGKLSEQFTPTLQLLEFKKIQGKNYKLVVSDGDHCTQCMSVNQSASVIDKSSVEKFQLLTFQDFSLTTINGTYKILLLRELKLGPKIQSKIGNPQKMEFGTKTAETSIVKQETSVPPSKEVAKTVNTLSTENEDFELKGKVVTKGDIKHWNNSRGTGKLFNATIVDSNGDEIQATFFNEAVDTFYQLVSENKVYNFSKGRVKLANRRYSSCDYQLTFDKNASIVEVFDDGHIEENYKFSKICTLKNKVGEVVDLCAVVVGVGPVVEFTSRKSVQLKKRTLTVVDDSNTEIELTLWNNQAENKRVDVGSVIIAKNLKVTDFQTCSLSTIRDSSKLVVNNTQIPEATVLLNWYKKIHGKEPSVKLTQKTDLSEKLPRVSLSELQERFKGKEEGQELLVISGFIGFIKKDDVSSIWYTACKNSEVCKKKVVLGADGLYTCSKCNETSSECSYCYMASIKIQDFSGSFWVRSFDNTAQKIVGYTASYLQKLHNTDEQEFDKVVNSLPGKSIEAVVKVSVYGGRTQATLQSVLEPGAQKTLELYLKDLNK